MKTQAKWAREVRELLKTEPFRDWFRQYNLLREDLKNAREHHLDLQMQAAVAALKADHANLRGEAFVYRAGDCEASAGHSQAEAAEIENASFEALSEFETARRHATLAWQNHERLEKLLDDQRQHREELRARADAARRIRGAEASAEAERLEAQVRELETTIERAAKEAEPSRLMRQKTEETRNTLWAKVEDAWSRAFRASMARSELSFQARKARGSAEAQFSRIAAERQRIEALQAQAKNMHEHVEKLEDEYAALLQRGAEGFGCILIEEFAYWPQQESVEHAWVVPLVDETRHFNIQVHPLQLYQVSRVKGLDFVEPVPDEVEVSEDARLMAFFEPVAGAARPAERREPS